MFVMGLPGAWDECKLVLLTYIFHLILSTSHTGECRELPSSPKLSGVEERSGPGAKDFRPRLDEDLPVNVTSQIERTVRLNCRVHNLGNKRVVWLRKKDVHILTIGPDVFTDDKRFSILHGDRTPDWTLQIKYPRREDQGAYECQVSTNPKLSYLVNLRIVVGDVKILGPDIVDVGDDLVLVCNVTGPDPPTYLDWWRDDQALADPDQGPDHGPGQGVRMVVTRGQQWVASRIVLKHVTSRDGGKYRCAASEAEQEVHSVRVIEGSQPAQLRSANGGSSSTSISGWQLYVPMLVLLCAALVLPNLSPSSQSSQSKSTSLTSTLQSLQSSPSTYDLSSPSPSSLSSLLLLASPDKQRTIRRFLVTR